MNVYVILTSCEVPRLAILHLVGKSWYMEIGLHPGVLKNLRDTIDRTLRGEQPLEGTMHKCNEVGTSYLCSYPEYKNYGSVGRHMPAVWVRCAAIPEILREEVVRWFRAAFRHLTKTDCKRPSLVRVVAFRLLEGACGVS